MFDKVISLIWVKDKYSHLPQLPSVCLRKNYWVGNRTVKRNVNQPRKLWNTRHVSLFMQLHKNHKCSSFLMVLVTESKNIHKAKKRRSGRAFSANPSLALTKDHLIWLSATWLLNLHKSCSKKKVLLLAECVHETKQT